LKTPKYKGLKVAFSHFWSLLETFEMYSDDGMMRSGLMGAGD